MAKANLSDSSSFTFNSNFPSDRPLATAHITISDNILMRKWSTPRILGPLERPLTPTAPVVPLTPPAMLPCVPCVADAANSAHLLATRRHIYISSLLSIHRLDVSLDRRATRLLPPSCRSSSCHLGGQIAWPTHICCDYLLPLHLDSTELPDREHLGQLSFVIPCMYLQYLLPKQAS